MVASAGTRSAPSSVALTRHNAKPSALASVRTCSIASPMGSKPFRGTGGWAAEGAPARDGKAPFRGGQALECAVPGAGHLTRG